LNHCLPSLFTLLLPFRIINEDDNDGEWDYNTRNDYFNPVRVNFYGCLLFSSSVNWSYVFLLR
jgi:hypothetical protein